MKGPKYPFHHSLADRRCVLLVPGKDVFDPNRLPPKDRRCLTGKMDAAATATALILHKMKRRRQ